MTHLSNSLHVRLHLTNVVGTGATQLLQSLLPALERASGYTVDQIHLPDRGALTCYVSSSSFTRTSVFRRRLPNALSRIFECTLCADRFDGLSPILVLGDLPLLCHAPQTVFVQNAHLIRPLEFKSNAIVFRYWVARCIFNLNKSRVRAFIVQSELMRTELERSYPAIAGRVHVIPQPVPTWLLNFSRRSHMRNQLPRSGLRLIYPAAGYPHKNHSLLALLDSQVDALIDQLVLTLPPNNNPAPHLRSVTCKGFLPPNRMIEEYEQADALLFLSKSESYGFPLVEAMFIGLPIVCPDLPYAHAMCGEQAIYFDANNPESLQMALQKLAKLLTEGWWPNWSERMASIPENWDVVAQRMLAVSCGVIE